MEVTRGQLFDEVWSTPLTALAKKYNVSDVAVAKACRKHAIPLPGVGHWAKVAAGKGPPTPNLPGQADDVVSIGMQVECNVQGERRPVPALQDLLGADDLPLCAPDAPLAPVTRATLKQLRRTTAAGVAQSDLPEGFEVRVSPASIDRAVQLLNTLEDALRRADVPYLPPVAGVRLRGADRHPVHFSLTEHGRAVESAPPAHGRAGWDKRERTRWEFDGRLVFTIHEYAELCRKTWSDGKRRALETKLGSVLLGVLAVAEALRARTQYWEDWERVRAEQARAAAEAKRRADEEASFVRSIVREARRWQRAAALNQYLDALANRLGEGAQNESTAAWLRRARGVVRDLDPLPARLTVLLKSQEV